MAIEVGAEPVDWSFQLARVALSVDVPPIQINVAI